MPWLRLFVAGLFNTEPRIRSPDNYVQCMVDKVATGQLRHRVIPFAPVSIIPPMVHTPSSLNTVLLTTIERRLGISEQIDTQSDVKEYWTEMYVHFFLVTDV